MTDYGQFCPVSKAMEVLDERWTMLVVRELLMGSTRFNQLRRGVPRMSPALLSKRLRRLERAGLLVRFGSGTRTSYQLTEAGRALGPVVDAIAAWGTSWLDLRDDDLDPQFLFFHISRSVPAERWPVARTVVRFVATDARPRSAQWWLVAHRGEVDLCDFDPGYEVDAHVTSDLRTLSLLWRGDLRWERTVRDGAVRVDAPAAVRQALPDWLGHSVLEPAPAG
ncbi:helix-turn-helix domain-containing protein [Nocardioides sp. TF02-7]|uniref:winged helix-turn-helix transcriptional regulator n=1 Tax=Nocardioides sp. TF02-7 TaxID=2917724 RepID=UPI001F067C8F|nr:helix-turn-helix domain-containing protein [Nocardioides sp. TF02-7]UMG91416.1 helix-turn-helix transcriptional regulator [Nocardioides sp. TF02-7]